MQRFELLRAEEVANVFRRATPRAQCSARMLPACYDEFRGNKMYSCIEHPAPQGERVYLAVPFEDKDAVKALGARWGRGHPVNEQSMSIMEVAYTPKQARAVLEWSNRYKSWWYWSGAPVRDDLRPEERLAAAEDTHSSRSSLDVRSAFARWPLDSATMMRVYVDPSS